MNAVSSPVDYGATLTSKMRSEGQNEHNDWLLEIGFGNNPPVEGLSSYESIEIPQKMIATEDLSGLIFGYLNE